MRTTRKLAAVLLAAVLLAACGGGGDGFEGAWNTNVVEGKTVGVLEVDLDLPMPGVALVRLTPAGHR